jgi:tetratricopeptide (TPR) repeat protein
VHSAKQEQCGNATQFVATDHDFYTEPAPGAGSLAPPPENDGTDSLFTEFARHPLAHAAATSAATTDPSPDQETHARQLADYSSTWESNVNRRQFLRLLPAGGYPFAIRTANETTPGFDSFNVDLVEHFKSMKNLLMDNDNIFGANSVILSVQEQIGNLRQLRQSYRVPSRQELLHIQIQFTDLCGWLYQDSGDYHAATYWSGRALEWSHMCNDQDSIAFILARRSQLAGDAGDPTEAIDAAEAALNTAPHKTGRVSAVALTHAAHAHALRGDKASCERSYAMAQNLTGRLEVGPTCPWALFLDHSYIEVQRARSLTALGEYGAAIESFQKAISCLPRGYRRDCGVYLAREAAAHMGHGDVEQACAVGLQALAIGAETRSARIIGELKHLDTAMRRFPSSASTANFHEAMHSTFSPSELMGVP